MIPDHKKEELRDIADIVDVVSDYVTLKRSGSGYMGLCPFHNEKTPSFHVNPSLRIYKCFGCGAGGDVFNFVMETEGVGFVEAMRSLADRYKVDLPDEQQDLEADEGHKLKEGVYHALRFAGHWFYSRLTETDEGKPALEYLQKRGFTPKTIRKYGLGYAPDSFNALIIAAKDAGINPTYLYEAGLVKEGKDGKSMYDAFRGRVMFPIFNPAGKVIAFGGRILKKDEKQPKYINSPQTPVYNKSEVLYGIQIAKNEIRKTGEAILVEGYTDVLTLHQTGVLTAIATSGTSITPDQMRILKRYGEQLLMIYDSDTAGQMAMIRGIDIALSAGLGVKLMALPDGQDPDSFVKQFGKDGFEQYKKEHARDFVTYMIRSAERTGDWGDPVGKKTHISRILTSIAHIPDKVTVMSYLQHLSSLSGISERALSEELGMVRKQVRKQSTASAQAQKQPVSEEKVPADQKEATGQHPDTEQRNQQIQELPSNEKEVIRMMLQYGEEMVEYVGSLINEDHFENPHLKTLFNDIIERYKNEQPISFDVYAEKEHPYPQLVGEIAVERHTLSERGHQKRGRVLHRDEDPYRSAQGALKALKLTYLDRLKKFYSEVVSTAEGEEKQKASRILTEISRQFNRFQSTRLEDLFPRPESKPASENQEST